MSRPPSRARRRALLAGALALALALIHVAAVAGDGLIDEVAAADVAIVLGNKAPSRD